MKIMAVDYGDAHTGLACCDRTQTLASPIGVIDERNFQTCVEKVAAENRRISCVRRWPGLKR